jgi:hypothetical protein
MKEKKVTQDVLRSYINAHGLKMTRLAKLMGVSDDIVTSNFKHHKDIHGKPRSFNAQHLALLNEALPQLAKELRGCLLTFGTKEVKENKRHKWYDPGLLEPLKKIGEYMNLTAMLYRVCGWSNDKKMAVFNSANKKMHGRIYEKDVIAINEEILAIAGVLEGYEIIPEEKQDE